MQEPSTASETASETVAGVHPLVEHLDGLIADLRGHVPQALREFDSTAIHQARVATRRLSAGFEVLEPLLTPGDFRDLRKALKKLRRRLGPHRDLDVLIDHVDELAAEEKNTVPAAFLSRVLRARREKLRRETLEKGRVHRTLMQLGGYDSLRDELKTHGAGIVALVAEGVHASADEFSALADLLSHQLTEPEEDGGVGGMGGTGGIDPHELRIAGKHLRYSLELADAMHTQGVGPLLKTFKQLQEALGDWHDFVVLAETALEAVKEAELTHRDSVLAGRVLTMGAEALGLAGEHLMKFARLWGEKGAGMTGTIRELLPLTQPAPAPHPDEWPVGGGLRPRAKKRKKAAKSEANGVTEVQASGGEDSQHAGSDTTAGQTAPIESPE